MKVTHLCYAIIMLLSPLKLSGDTVKLTDGTVYKGTIKTQNRLQVTIRYKLSEGVWDWKTIPVTKIKEILKVLPDERAYNELSKNFPAPDYKEAEWYTATLDKQITPFLTKFPNSRFSQQVSKIKKEYHREREIVKNGGIKHHGKLLSAEEALKNFYILESTILAEEFDRCSEKSKYNEAFEKFEVLVKVYPHSNALHTRLKSAIDLLTQYSRQLQLMEVQHKKLAEDTKKKIANMNASNQKKISKIIENQISAHKERVFRLKYIQKRRWLPVMVRDLKGIQDAVKMTDSLLSKAKLLASQPNPKAGHLFVTLFERLESNDIEEAKKIQQQLKNIHFPDKYLSMIGERMEAIELHARRKDRLQKMQQAYSGYTMEDVIAEEKELIRLKKEEEKRVLIATPSNKKENGEPSTKPSK